MEQGRRTCSETVEIDSAIGKGIKLDNAKRYQTAGYPGCGCKGGGWRGGIEQRLSAGRREGAEISTMHKTGTSTVQTHHPDQPLVLPHGPRRHGSRRRRRDVLADMARTCIAIRDVSDTIANIDKGTDKTHAWTLQ